MSRHKVNQSQQSIVFFFRISQGGLKGTQRHYNSAWFQMTFSELNQFILKDPLFQVGPVKVKKLTLIFFLVSIQLKN